MHSVALGKAFQTLLLNFCFVTHQNLLKLRKPKVIAFFFLKFMLFWKNLLKAYNLSLEWPISKLKCIYSVVLEKAFQTMSSDFYLATGQNLANFEISNIHFPFQPHHSVFKKFFFYLFRYYSQNSETLDKAIMLYHKVYKCTTHNI